MNDANIYPITTTNGSETITVDSEGRLIPSTIDLSTTGNCIIGSPYISSPYIYTYPQTEKFDIQLQKVENGWILHKDGKRFVITKPEQILKYLSE